MSSAFSFAYFTHFSNLRWLKTVSSTYILTGGYKHHLSLDATIIVLKNCPIIGEQVGHYHFHDTIGVFSRSYCCFISLLCHENDDTLFTNDWAVF